MSDARALLAWLLGELRAVVAWATEPTLWTLLLAGVALWSLAYAQPYTHRLDFGGDPVTHRRLDDAPYLSGFNDPQPAQPKNPQAGAPQEWWQLPEEAYRWAEPNATIVLPGIGNGRWLVTLRALGHPTEQSIPLTWSDGTVTNTVSLIRSPRPRSYHFFATAHNDLTLNLVTPRFNAPNDSRLLGFVAYRATFTPTANTIFPSVRQLALLAGTLALVYTIAGRLALQRRTMLVGGLIVVALLTLLLARYRLALTSFTPTLLTIAAGCYAITIIGITSHELRVTNKRISPLHPFTPSSPHLVIGLIVLAFALRLGVLHPQRQVAYGDTGLNRNNLRGFVTGQVYDTEALPGDAGGYNVPYPPGQYVVLAPLTLVIGGGDLWRRVIEVGGALWDALVVGLLWYAGRRAGVGERAALLGASLYLVAVPLLNSFAVGEYANIFGQGLALPLLVFLAFNQLRSEAAPRPVLCSLFPILLLLFAALGHLGVTISLTLLLICLGGVWLISSNTRRFVLPFILIGVAAATLVALCYYSAFLHLLDQTPVARQPSHADSPGLLVQTYAAFTRRVSLRDWLNPLLIVLGVAGVALLGQRAAARPLWRLLLAWLLATLISLVPPLNTLRWTTFVYPALCLGAGPALASLWRCGRAAQLVVVVSVALLLWLGVAYWVTRLANYLHT